MGRYLAQRLAGAIPTLLGVSVLTFAFIRLIPGDAIAARLGTSTALDPEQLASLRSYFGLDQPLRDLDEHRTARADRVAGVAVQE